MPDNAKRVIRGQAFLTARDQVTGTVYYVRLGVLAAMPWTFWKIAVHRG